MTKNKMLDPILVNREIEKLAAENRCNRAYRKEYKRHESDRFHGRGILLRDEVKWKIDHIGHAAFEAEKTEPRGLEKRCAVLKWVTGLAANSCRCWPIDWSLDMLNEEL